MKILKLLLLTMTFPVYGLDITCTVLNCNSTNDSLFETIDTTPDTKNIVSKDLTGFDLNIYSSNESGQVNTILFGNLESLNIYSNANNASGFKKSVTVAGLVTDLSVESQGFNGSNGKNTSRICAEKFISGEYGVDAYNFFINRHTLSSTTICDSTDYDYLLNNKFSCDTDYNSATTSSANVTLLESKRACRANIVRNKCVKKTYDIKCNQRMTGFKCCTSSNTWTNLQATTNPHGHFIGTMGGVCNPSRCVSQYNGYEVVKSYIGTIDDVNDANYCTSKFISTTPTLSYASGASSTSVTVNATTRNNVSLPIPTVRNSSGVAIGGADYTLFLTNVNAIKSAGLVVRNCLGLDGSATNDYTCDILPGSAVTLRLKAIDKNGNVTSNEVAITINESIYVTQRRSNTFNCLSKKPFCSNTYIGSSSYYILSNGAQVGSLDNTCQGTGMKAPIDTYTYTDDQPIDYDSCETYSSVVYMYRKHMRDDNGIYLYIKSYSESTESGLRIYADFNGNFP